MPGLRTVVIATGVGSAILFAVIGPLFQLQLYGDGSIFSYAVAVQDAWAFHWHNIATRLSVYLLCLAPAEAFVALTHSAAGGIAVYGLLFFAAPLIGLALTFALDRSPRRVIFVWACFATATLCPLVFGFPTEMWLAHALFWPALAAAHHARAGIAGVLIVCVLLVLLVLAHEGGLVLAAAIMATLVLRGLRGSTLSRAIVALLASIAVWLAVKLSFPPDPYVAEVMARAAWHFFDLSIVGGSLVLLLLAALAAYAMVYLAANRIAEDHAHLIAMAVVIAALALYWLAFDQALHAVNRYYLRTLVLLMAPAVAVLASLQLTPEGRTWRLIDWLRDCIAKFAICPATVRAVTGALIVVMAIHVVETTKFVRAWTLYKDAITALATGPAADPGRAEPGLGDPRFVSSARLRAEHNRLSWFSTTPYLSVILGGFAPNRLVIDPAANYFWLSCATATRNAGADRAVPAESRQLIQVYSCLYR